MTVFKEDAENRITGSPETNRPFATYRHRRHDSSYPSARDAPVFFTTDANTWSGSFRSGAK